MGGIVRHFAGARKCVRGSQAQGIDAELVEVQMTTTSSP